MKNQGRLKEKEKMPRLEAQKQKRFSYDAKAPRKRAARLRKWYVVYLVTTLTTVIAAVLLLAVGIGAGNGRFSDMFSPSVVADKVADFFVGIDFPSFSIREDRPSSDGGFVSLPLDTNEKDDLSNDSVDTDESTDAGVVLGGLYDFDYSKVPEGSTPIIPMDLSLSSYGSNYINNSTGYTPDISALIKKDLKAGGGYEQLALSTSPLVLIVHTHGTEAYSEDGALYCSDSVTDYARTTDTAKNVVSVGNTIAEILNKQGIPTAHCTVMHDSVQYKDSYSRAEATIRRYLEEYPTIKLVIDVHRDAIVKSSGELVRPVTELDGHAAAQVMCVVGSDWEGDKCPNWENNLSLALKLRELLNSECSNICRPVNLKGHTYNQELAPYSLLLEIGSSGNSLAEAQRSAMFVAQKLCELMKMI